MSSYKKRNPMARELETKLYTNRVVPDKRRKLKEKQHRKEMKDGKTPEDKRGI